MIFDIVEPIFLLYGAVFLAALMLVEGLYLLYVDTRAGQGAVNRRMSLLAAGKDSRSVFETLRRRPLRRAHQLGPLGDIVIWLDRLIAQSGLSISTGRMLLLMLGLSGASFLFLLYLVNLAAIPGSLLMGLGGVIICPLMGIGIPFVVLTYLKGRRIQKFNEQLPDALDIMVRGLQAGHPISAAMGLVTKEMGDPMGTEIGIAVDEMTYGLDMREAMENMSRRIELQDFQYVVVSINIQGETGGNLAEVLQRLSSVIRDRYRMFQKIRAVSSEGRLSAIVLSMLPFVVGAGLFAWNPNWYLDVLDDPWFLPTFLGGLGLMLFGIYILYRMVNFRV
jgi:tight adherence protein B